MSAEKAQVLDAPKPAPQPKPGKGKAADEAPRDTFREVVETVVFVIVLVLLLKTFVAEAFVIPTGSMATTLYGYQKVVTCSDCGFEFPVNCSNEVDPQDGVIRKLIGYTCPNCRHHETWPNGAGPGWNSGDRVLVAKFLYDGPFGGRPSPLDVVVFKYPESPQKEGTAMNYIKRLYAVGGDTMAIYKGDLYVARSIDYAEQVALDRKREEEERRERAEEGKSPRPQGADFWKKDHMYVNAPQAIDAFRKGRFLILRKAPDKQLALRRIVYDNDRQAKSLRGKLKPRWLPEDAAGWSIDDPNAPKRFQHQGDELAFVRYQHLIPADRRAPGEVAPTRIGNFLGYNAGQESPEIQGKSLKEEWVPDLMVECDVTAEAWGAEVVLELAKGPDRFQARFDTGSGHCTLVRIWTDNGQVREEALGRTEKPTRLKGAGTWHVRLSDFDDRLTVWVDGDLPFGDGVDYPGRADLKEVEANDVEQPARIGVKGRATVSKVQLWRDTYYTITDNQDVQTFYVQPGHYLCLGDNSAASSDSRYWGLVPGRLLLGRALMVYYPFSRAGVIE